MRCRIADQQVAWKKGRDASIKLLGIQPHPTYLSTIKDMYGGLYTEPFYAVTEQQVCPHRLPQ